MERRLVQEKEAQAAGQSVYERLNELAAPYVGLDRTLDDCHLLGYFHGNRSPRADASLRGMVSGLTLNRTPAELARRYLAAIQALGYGTRHIIETMNRAGHGIRRIRLCGGGARNPLLIQEHADITGCEVTVSPEPDAPLLGSAMLAAAAAGCHADVFAAMRAMSRPGSVFEPRAQTRSFHDRKYRVFLEMHDDQIKYRRMMAPEVRKP